MALKAAGRALIVTNGDCAAAALRAAGMTADILPWRDVLHDGPVPALAPGEFVAVRADFLARHSGGDRAIIAADMRDRDARLAQAGDHGPLTLCFEHDLYDQLQLVQILARLADRQGGEIGLVQADAFLSEQQPPAIKALAGSRRPVSGEQMEYAARMWRAFTAATPQGLEMPPAGPAPLPFVPAALERLIAEFPDCETGLSLTQTRILQALEQGDATAGKLFGAVTALEAAKFMSDLSFAAVLEELASAPVPLLEARAAGGAGSPKDGRRPVDQPLTLTAAGRAVIAGRDNHIALNGIDRWIGGSHLSTADHWVREGPRLRRRSTAAA